MIHRIRVTVKELELLLQLLEARSRELPAEIHHTVR